MTACFGLSSTLLLLTCLTPTPLCLHGAAGGWRRAVQAARCRGRTASFSPAPPASPTAAANPQKSSRADNLSLLFPPLVFPSSTALPPCSEPLSPIFPFFFFPVTISLQAVFHFLEAKQLGFGGFQLLLPPAQPNFGQQSDKEREPETRCREICLQSCQPGPVRPSPGP